ncbi:putative pterin-4-alpha-carbinolamine dehydratase, chloroplastic [Drosera capensis]
MASFFEKLGFGSKPTPTPSPTPSPIAQSPDTDTDTDTDTDAPSPNTHLAQFGAACLWGVELAFQRVPGVTKTEPGVVDKPSYEDVCTGKTEHVEVVRVEFDGNECGYGDLLGVFWGRHDPTTVNRQVVGWRLLEEKEGLKLQCLWKLRDFKCGIELINRVAKVAEEAGHYPSLHLEEPYHVRAELWTPLIGGLSMNDFIVAAKIDEIKTSDLVPRKRVWA